MKEFHSIVITGASGGIGRALVYELARPGTSLLLLGRNISKLKEVSEEARSKGAMAEFAFCDVTDGGQLSKLVREFDARRNVDLLVANAGVSSGLGQGQSPEPEGHAQRLIEVNLIGAINTVETLLPEFITRKAGHIAIISSLAGVRPHADMPSYSASKSGLRAYGIALRGWLRGKGVGVSVIMPGFVTSPMSARHHGPKPFEVSAENAAKIIVRGIRNNRSMISFPWQLLLLIRLGNLLPAPVSDWFERRFAAEIRPENE
ncbi:SDR family NAD(P)-dependent oxidoreductase [Pseudohalocynthiibacter aestuariivivens]|uniref:SDR family NAD(P)-dependent oxidoreductase n=1 Tax=Pseudohalocynthiibacter aestuariivivens TaxID=1591409 RepID=A0ABV5JHN8_9RHOB|nr:SDR family NAD(P)-dependent oxidoreductase [Pseudohalocynthiibacter aestuariivivens]MBS9715320.1 SDR family NAD(P)-dependent oxidoreductase [Pseudohalocynthiibacter aestuariivivens]